MSIPPYSETGGSSPDGTPQPQPAPQFPVPIPENSPDGNLPIVPRVHVPRVHVPYVPYVPRVDERDDGTEPAPPGVRRVPRVEWWEPALVLVATFVFLALLAPRVITYLSPLTGDEPFYLMTSISMIEDRDINECNNYRQREEARFYPASLVTGRILPYGWLGWFAS